MSVGQLKALARIFDDVENLCKGSLKQTSFSDVAISNERKSRLLNKLQSTPSFTKLGDVISRLVDFDGLMALPQPSYTVTLDTLVDMIVEGFHTNPNGQSNAPPIYALEEKISHLQEIIEAKNIEFQNLANLQESDMDVLRDEISSLSQQLSASEHSVDNLTKVLTATQQKNSMLENDVKLMSSALEDREKQLAREKELVANRQSDIPVARVVELQSQLQSFKKANEELITEANQLKRTSEMLSKELANKKEEVLEYKEAVELADEQTSALQEEINSAKEAVDRYKEKVAVLEGKLQGSQLVSDANNILKEEIERLNNTNNALQIRNSDLQTKLQDSEVILQNKEQMDGVIVAEAQTSIASARALQTENSELRQKYYVLHEAKNALQLQSDEALNSLRAELSRSLEKNNEQLTKLESLEKDLRNMTAELHQHQQLQREQQAKHIEDMQQLQTDLQSKHTEELLQLQRKQQVKQMEEEQSKHAEDLQQLRRDLQAKHVEELQQLRKELQAKHVDDLQRLQKELQDKHGEEQHTKYAEDLQQQQRSQQMKHLEELQQLRKELEEKHAEELQQLHSLLDDKDQEEARLRASEEEIKETLTITKATLKQLQDKSLKSEEEEQLSKSSFIRLQHEVQQLSTKLSAAEGKLSAADEEYNVLQRIVDEKETAELSMQETIVELKENITILKARLSQTEAVSRDLSALQEQYNNALAKISDSDSIIALMRTQIADKDRTEIQLSNEIAELKVNFSIAQQKLQTHTQSSNSNSDAERQLAESQEEIEVLKELLDQKEADEVKLESENMELKEKLSISKARSNQLSQQNEQLTENLNELRRKCSELEALNELDRLRSKGSSSSLLKAPSLHKLKPPSSTSSSSLAVDVSSDWTEDWADVGASALTNANTNTTANAGNRSPLRISGNGIASVGRPDSLSPGTGSVGKVRKQTTSFYHEACSSIHQSTPVNESGRKFFVHEHVPIALIQLGEFCSRVSVWNSKDSRFELRFSCRTLKAVAIDDKNRIDIVRYASSQSDSMFKQFRDEGHFVGADAYHVLYNHPDRGLRGALKQQNIIAEGHIADLSCLDKLLSDLFIKGLYSTDGSNWQLLVAYKLSYSNEEMASISQTLFESLGCHKVCFLSEANLLWKSINPYPSSCLVVDIGATTTTVYPIYSDCVVHNAVRFSHVGGEHITSLLTLLIHARQVEHYSALLPRRCRQVAMEAKESIAFVAEDFTNYQRRYGKCQFEAKKVMSTQNLVESYQQGLLKYVPDLNETETLLQSTSANSNLSAATSTKSLPFEEQLRNRKEIERSYEYKLPEGTSIPLTLDIELFHCTEVLFNPVMSEECEGEMGLMGIIREALQEIDVSVQAEVCAHVIIGGGSARLEGLGQRVQRELVGLLSSLSDDEEHIIPAVMIGEGDRRQGSYSDSAADIFESAISRGATNRIVSSLNNEAAIEPQNFLTSLDFEARGSSEICLALIS